MPARKFVFVRAPDGASIGLEISIARSCARGLAGRAQVLRLRTLRNADATAADKSELYVIGPIYLGSDPY